MIEKMIEEISPFLPLKISTVSLRGSQLKLSGEDWYFSVISCWRITEDEKMLLGCYDSDITEVLQLKDKLITEVLYQDSLLKLDPTFVLSTNQLLEIFSTDTIEPWTFCLSQVGIFIGTPGDPSTFMKR